MDDPILATYGLVWISLALHGSIAGEAFDVGLRRVDPEYRNQRDLLRDLVTGHRDGAGGPRGGYGYFANRVFRAVDDRTVEGLRRKVVHAYLVLVVFTLPGLPLMWLVRSRLAGFDPTALAVSMISLQVLVGAYWVRRTGIALRDQDRTILTVIYGLAAILASVAALISTVQTWPA